MRIPSCPYTRTFPSKGGSSQGMVEYMRTPHWGGRWRRRRRRKRPPTPPCPAHSPPGNHIQQDNLGEAEDPSAFCLVCNLPRGGFFITNEHNWLQDCVHIFSHLTIILVMTHYHRRPYEWKWVRVVIQYPLSTHCARGFLSELSAEEAREKALQRNQIAAPKCKLSCSYVENR